MLKNLDSKTKKEIIEKNLESISIIKDKSYVNNTFAIDVGSEKSVPEFERQFQVNLINTINKYFESKNADPKKYNRSIIYSINNTKNNIVINF